MIVRNRPPQTDQCQAISIGEMAFFLPKKGLNK